MLPARNAPVLAGRALRFDRALRARGRPILVQGHAVLNRGKAPDGTLSGRTLIFIVSGDVVKVPLIEQSMRFVVRGLRFWDHSRDSSLIALQDLLAVEVTAVG